MKQIYSSTRWYFLLKNGTRETMIYTSVTNTERMLASGESVAVAIEPRFRNQDAAFNECPIHENEALLPNWRISLKTHSGIMEI